MANKTRKAQGTKVAPSMTAEGTVLVGYTVAVSGGRAVKREGKGATKQGKVERRAALVTVTEHEARGLAERIRAAFAGCVRDLCASTLFGPVTDAPGLAALKARLAVHEARAAAFNARPEAGVEGVALSVVWGVKPLGLTVGEASARAVEGLRAMLDAARSGEEGAVNSALQTHENVPRLLPAGVLREAADAAVREVREARKLLHAGMRASGGKARPSMLGAGLMLVETEAALAMLAAPVTPAIDPDVTAPPPSASVARLALPDPEPTAPILAARLGVL